jgi:polyhydroxybutyrate depolymerase
MYVDLALVASILILGGVAVYFLRAPRSVRPRLGAQVVNRKLFAGGRQRTFLTYIPPDLPPHAPLLIVLHGSGQDAEGIRQATGFSFERLADQHCFALVYPQALRKHWNDGLKSASDDAVRGGVDDKAFLLSLMDWMCATEKIALGLVFVFGYSNGGQMAFHLIHEVKGRVAAIAVVGASLPLLEGSIVQPSCGAVPVMLVNGMDDPFNPYDGGRVSLFGLGNGRKVQSARASAEYFARLHAAQLSRTQHLPAQRRGDLTNVLRQAWLADCEARVVLYSVYGGGHVIPQPFGRMPRLLGSQTTALDATFAACAFFGTLRAAPPQLSSASLSYK